MLCCHLTMFLQHATVIVRPGKAVKEYVMEDCLTLEKAIGELKTPRFQIFCGSRVRIKRI